MRDWHTSGTQRITRPRRCLKRLGGAACLAALALAIGASPAAASVTIGQISADSEGCEGPVDILQPTVTAGNAYVVPAVGTITSWSHQAGPSEDQIALREVTELVAEAVGQ